MTRRARLSTIKVKVYDFIVEFKKNHDGNSPSIREIGRAVGITSTSVTNYYLESLAGMEIIKLKKQGSSRMISVSGGSWTPPAAPVIVEIPQPEKKIPAPVKTKKRVRPINKIKTPNISPEQAMSIYERMAAEL